MCLNLKLNRKRYECQFLAACPLACSKSMIWKITSFAHCLTCRSTVDILSWGLCENVCKKVRLILYFGAFSLHRANFYKLWEFIRKRPVIQFTKFFQQLKNVYFYRRCRMDKCYSPAVKAVCTERTKHSCLRLGYQNKAINPLLLISNRNFTADIK